MKALTACLYCNKKKECPDSVKAHTFLDECFEAEDESIREALKDLVMLSKITLPVEVFEKTNSAAELLVEQAERMKKLAHYIAEENCEKYCVNSNVFCTEKVPCAECKSHCGCGECKDMSNFRLDWSALNK